MINQHLFAITVLLVMILPVAHNYGQDEAAVDAAKSEDEQQVDREDEVKKHLSLARKARAQAEQIRNDMLSDVPGGDISAIPEDDKRLNQLKDEQLKEKTSLEKLVSLQ